MSQRSEAERPATEDLSALMDGELHASAVATACREWRDDEHMRRQWHAYHLIGDVMRSEDLASAPRRDADFLASLRKRMADEPVVLAPSAAFAPSATGANPVRARRSWMAPAAVAAGFAVVAGTLVVTQMAGGLSMRESGADATIARSQAPLLAVGDKAASAAEASSVVPDNGQLVRDARLDEYLAAHKKFGGSSLPGGPSGFLRNASVDVPAR